MFHAASSRREARKRRAVFRGVMRAFAKRLGYRGPLFGVVT